MPELPEVETTRRGIAPHCVARTLEHIVVRERRLRWPVDAQLNRRLAGQRLQQLYRRGKYLIFEFESAWLLLHLGMSGSLRIVSTDLPAQKHDHVDLVFAGGKALRLRDPRRFGALLYTRRPPEQHDRLRHLGPEPLSDDFNDHYLIEKCTGRKQSIKTFIMDSRIVVGVGNIYANEALFLAGIHPARAAGRIGRARLATLTECIKQVLRAAIQQGGTTLRDFTDGEGKPGYFKQQLNVYGRAGLPCPRCQTPLKEQRLGQRATVYCPRCQR